MKAEARTTKYIQQTTSTILSNTKHEREEIDIDPAFKKKLKEIEKFAYGQQCERKVLVEVLPDTTMVLNNSLCNVQKSVEVGIQSY